MVRCPSYGRHDDPNVRKRITMKIVVFERGHHASFANYGRPHHIGEVITERSRLMLQTPRA